jgi:septum formation protein
MCDRLPKLILASRSPRRRELLLQAGYSFEVRPPEEAVEYGLGHRSEGVVDGESPAELVARLASQKAADVARNTRSGLILGCDTVVECQGEILGKPADKDHAREMLGALSGREHRVLSGLCLWRVSDGRSLVRVAATTLRMDQLTDDQLDEYLASGAWQGKAGAFGYQDRLGWVHVIEGSESNVVGLPLELLAEMLAQFEAENGPLAADHPRDTNRGAEKGQGPASQRPG